MQGNQHSQSSSCALLIQETRIGMSVNAIRKHCTDEEVIALAKVLIKDWKRLLGMDICANSLHSSEIDCAVDAL